MTPIEFYNETVQRARKRYECECCRKLIEVGETYARRSATNFGDLSDRKLCLICNEAVTEYCSETDKEFNYTDIQALIS